MVTTKHTAARREPLSRDQVLRAAVALADQGGIGALSMRKLGQVLGVEAMSLYNHVANKSDLLDGMIDIVFSEIGLPAGDTGWKPAMRQRAIVGLAASPEPDAVDLLISTARQDKDSRVRRQAVNAISRSRDPRARAFLENVLKQ